MQRSVREEFYSLDGQDGTSCLTRIMIYSVGMIFFFEKRGMLVPELVAERAGSRPMSCAPNTATLCQLHGARLFS